MEPIVLIHGYSAESRSTAPQAIADIYGSFPDALRRVYGAPNVVEIDLSRYISLEDGLAVDDISRALDRALRRDFPQLLPGRFNVLVHSTGALVIRNWIRTFSPRPSPVRRILYLAGANFGSGWAHIGKGQLAKWARLVFEAGAERGVQVLDALELGCSWTLDLHLHFLRKSSRMREDYDVFEFVLVGSQADVRWYEAPIRYAHEDGSDGVVRVSASNVNVQYLRFAPTREAIDLGWKEARTQQSRHIKRTGQRSEWYELVESYRPGQDGLPEVPLAIPYECAHSGEEMGIVVGAKPRAQVMRLVQTALGTDDDAMWAAALQSFAAETRATEDEVRRFQAPSWWQKWITEPREQYDRHAQVVFRLRDQNGRPVEHYDVFFDSENTAEGSDIPIHDLFEDTHRNEVTPNTIAFYLRTDKYDRDADDWVPRLPKVEGAWLEITAVEPDTEEIVYLPFRYELDAQDLVEWIRPHRTTIIDVEMMRLPSDAVFMMTPSEASG